jgi:hypothetical protein
VKGEPYNGSASSCRGAASRTPLDEGVDKAKEVLNVEDRRGGAIAVGPRTSGSEAGTTERLWMSATPRRMHPPYTMPADLPRF